MAADDVPPIFRVLADRLRNSAAELTDRWLERLGGRLGVRPRRMLPTDELRDHIPTVLTAAADSLALPAGLLPNETTELLRSVVQLRRRQGYDIQELLIEIDALSDLVFEWASGWAADVEDRSTAGEAMRAAARLAQVLRQVAMVAVGTYRDEEVRQSQELASRLSDFVGMLSHELMSPLNTAGISAVLLTEQAVAEDPEKRRKHTDVIRDRLDRIHHLVEDVRAVAVAEGARAESRWLPIREVIQTVVREVEESARHLGVQVRDEEPVVDFDVDAARVEIALMNLVTNAIKFSDPAKEERWVRITAGPAEPAGPGGRWRITVEDNGRGIERASHGKVFQRFFRALPDVEGTGLGLQIAKRLVEQRGGTLWFESEAGRGTVFHMEIPESLPAPENQPAGGAW